MPAIQVFCRAASLPIRCFSSSIAILELSYANVRGWWDYPSFYPKCQQPLGWCCKPESAARSSVISQDTGMAMTPIGHRGFTRRPSHSRDCPVRGTAGTHDETGLNGGHRPHCRARRASPVPSRPTGRLIQTDRLRAAGIGQQGKDRGQAPPESAGTVQRGNQNVPRERSRLAGL
jgi:hypothetical protein